jgi:hypothetical protein
MMKIELKDHIGESPSGAAVDHNQWIVFCDGVQVGYLPKYANAWLQCIVSFDETTKAELIQAVNETAALQIGGVAMPVDPDLQPQDDEEEYE